MHRTGVDRAFGNGRRGFCRRAQILCGISLELRQTASRAEIISSAIMKMTVLRGMRIDQHSADRVTHAFLDLAIIRPPMVVARMPMRMVVLRGRRFGLRDIPP